VICCGQYLDGPTVLFTIVRGRPKLLADPNPAHMHTSGVNLPLYSFLSRREREMVGHAATVACYTVVCDAYERLA